MLTAKPEQHGKQENADTQHAHTNRLIGEKSPYLLQHAHNPVDWYPWKSEAFEKAEREDKPIFLSIGYSTCHWCHVMERESFEDNEVAAYLNENYVCIKVDREERPDIDSIYMTVCQALTGQGGWPLTVVMTPDKKPFFAGTYFPKDRKYGRPGLLDILGRLLHEWRENRARVEDSGDKIVEALTTINQERTKGGRGAEERQGKALSILAQRGDGTPNLIDEKGHMVDDTLADDAYGVFVNTFDNEYGGFGDAPKFPSPHNLLFLLRYHHLMHEEKALSMVTSTLRAMAAGGIRDFLGGGFARYSVDRRWLIPHFEKMLYDNAMLAMAFVEAYQVTGETEFADVAKEIFDYVLRDMVSPEGGFYCAEDADSEGVEGLFYAWTPEEIQTVLGDDFGTTFCDYFHVTDMGNFDGRNVLNLIAQDTTAFCTSRGLDETLFLERVETAKEKLWYHREQRVHPHKDDKVLTSWNGLMIAALAKGYQVLGDESYLEAAVRCANFIENHLRREDGRLLARYRDGEAGLLGYLDDYAFLTWGLLELYESNFAASYLRMAVELARDMRDLFWDKDGGGFFLYGSDAEQLIARPKEIYDGALPSGNSVVALNLLRLARMTGELEWEELAHDSLAAFAGEVERYPAGFTQYLMAVLFAAYPEYEIILVGDLGTKDCDAMVDCVRQRYLPNSVLVIQSDKEDLRDIAPFLVDYVKAAQGRSATPTATAYVCQGFSCQAPTTDVLMLSELLKPLR